MGNAQIKLVFPSHGLPFVVPYTMAPKLKAKIDDILKDMGKKDASIKESGKLRLPDGTVLDPPTPNDWVLVDTLYATIIHDSLVSELIRSGRTYMVLPMRASNLSSDNLKEAIKAVNSSARGASAETPPIYTPS